MANQFPTDLNTWQDGEVIESDWANKIEEKIGKNNSEDTSSLDYRVRYLENIAHEETPTGTVNGINDTFTLAFNPIVASVKLYVAGLRMKRGVDYTLGGTGNKTITMVTIPPDGSTILVDYIKEL